MQVTLTQLNKSFATAKTMSNSVDPDQPAEETSQSGSTMFAR